MLKKIKIEITNKEKIIVHPDGVISGYIHLNIEGFFFPHEDWDDFMFILLIDWFDKFIELERHRIYSAHFCFLEDSYSFEIQKKDPIDKIILYRSQQKDESRIINIYDIDANYICNSYFDCLGETLKYFENISIQDVGYRHLKKAYNTYIKRIS